MSINDPQKSIAETKVLKNMVTIVYALQAASIPLIVTYFIAPLLILWKRKQAEGTWLETHLRWQLNTFWFSLAGFIMGIATTAVSVQLATIILATTLMWFVYRIGQGWTKLSRGLSMFRAAGPDKALS